MGHVCPWWLAYTFDNPLRVLFHKPEVIFSGYVRPGRVVADVGCGMGYFSIGLARMVGDRGKVYAVDLQEKMLDRVKKRALKAGLSGIVIPQLCGPDSLSLRAPLDFALAFWMLHETPDKTRFLTEIYAALKNGGVLLVTEPKMHVSARQMEEEVAAAQGVGFFVAERPSIAFSRSAVLRKT